MNSVELREQRAALVTDSRKLLERAEAEKRELSAEEDGEWQRRMRDVDDLESKIKSAERKEKIESLEGELTRSQGRKTAPTAASYAPKEVTRSDRNKMLKAWMGYGRPLKRSSLDGDVLNRCADNGFPINQNTIRVRSLNTLTTGAGGATTFTTTSTDLLTVNQYYSPIEQAVRKLKTEDGNPFLYPRSNDLANTVAIVGQGNAESESDPVFDQPVNLGAYTFRTFITVTLEMLEDAVFDVESYVQQTLAIRMARTNESYLLGGTGSGQPKGLLAAATAAGNTVSLAAGNKTIGSFDQLLSIIQKVDPIYRANGTLVFSDAAWWDLRKLKDTTGRYILDDFRLQLQAPTPLQIGGYKYLISNSVPYNLFSKNLVVFCDLSQMVMRIVDEIQITRLNELFRLSAGAVAFEVRMRWDSAYVGPSSSIAALVSPAS